MSIETTSINYGAYLITTDRAMMKPERVHCWLSEVSYWAKNIPYDVFKRSFDNSFCIGVLNGEEQVGYARFVTDYATFAYLADVYVEEAHRGNKLSKIMMEMLMNQDWVKNLRRVMLATVDAHGLYEQYGFTNPKNPSRIMEITRPGIYGDSENPCS